MVQGSGPHGWCGAHVVTPVVRGAGRRFRYVEITNFPEFHPDNITALHFHTDLQSGVSFETSSIIINTIQVRALPGVQCSRIRACGVSHDASSPSTDQRCVRAAEQPHVCSD